MNTKFSPKGLVPVNARRAIKIGRAISAHRCGLRRYSYPAINQLDKKLLGFVGTAPGTFLEIGANDGFSQSNTYALERLYGWRGILIEPLPHLASWCRRIRKNSMCFERICGSPNQDGEYIDIVDINLMSVALGQQDEESERRRLGVGGHRTYRVLSQSLSSIIDEAGMGPVDVMSIDVEGAELPVLSGLDMSRHAPKWILVETANVKEVERALSPALAPIAALSHHDYLFKRR